MRQDLLAIYNFSQVENLMNELKQNLGSGIEGAYLQGDVHTNHLFLVYADDVTSGFVVDMIEIPNHAILDPSVPLYDTIVNYSVESPQDTKTVRSIDAAVKTISGNGFHKIKDVYRFNDCI